MLSNAIPVSHDDSVGFLFRTSAMAGGRRFCSGRGMVLERIVGTEAQPARLTEESYAAADAQTDVHEAGQSRRGAARCRNGIARGDSDCSTRKGDRRLHAAGVIGRLAALKRTLQLWNRRMASRIGVGLHRPA